MDVNNVVFLLVTCSMEPMRANVLRNVVENIITVAPVLYNVLTVFDNASTEPDTLEVLNGLNRNFAPVFRASENVGYWSAIDWWLDSMNESPPKYTYIIESDVIHYDFNKLRNCVDYLDIHNDVGSVRLLEFSVKNKQFYNKDARVEGSRVSAWQSSTNKATGERIVINHDEGDLYKTTFLTQLCALNRYETMLETFKRLRGFQKFSELDFQKLYWEKYKSTGLLDGGIFHAELTAAKNNLPTGSWTPIDELKRMGYLPSRFASITPQNEYTVQRMI